MKRKYEDPETGAYVKVKPDAHGAPGVYWLLKVYCPPRFRSERGATRCLQAVCHDADRQGAQLRLMVIPSPPTEVRKRVLREFYRGFGFYGTEEMAREPRTSGPGWPD